MYHRWYLFIFVVLYAPISKLTQEKPNKHDIPKIAAGIPALLQPLALRASSSGSSNRAAAGKDHEMRRVAAARQSHRLRWPGRQICQGPPALQTVPRPSNCCGTRRRPAGSQDGARWQVVAVAGERAAAVERERQPAWLALLDAQIAFEGEGHPDGYTFPFHNTGELPIRVPASGSQTER